MTTTGSSNRVQAPGTLSGPAGLAIYYGWPSLVNGKTTINDAVAEFAQFNMVVFGDGLEHAAHGDHAKTQQIITALIGQGVEVYGYIDMGVSTQNLSLVTATQYVDEWNAMGVTGIFWDDAGYDFGVDRARQTVLISYTHSLSLTAFVNAWDPEDIFGTDGGVPTPLAAGDWYLAESHPVSNGSHSDLSFWWAKSISLTNYRDATGVNLAAIATGNDSNSGWPNASGYRQSLWSAYLFDFDAFGFTNPQYSASGSRANDLSPLPAVATQIGTAYTSPPTMVSTDTFTRTTDIGTIWVTGDASEGYGTFRGGVCDTSAIGDFIWPECAGSPSPHSDTYGPRQRASSGFRYDWHRGVDIPQPKGLPVYAMRDGVVRIAGAHSGYSDPLVQIRHRESSPYLYTNVLHMLITVVVTAGDLVTVGDLVGYSGESSSGFDHMHMEYRDGCVFQVCNTHPWGYLPYIDTPPPSPTFTGATSATAGSLLLLDVATPAYQLDLDGVAIEWGGLLTFSKEAHNLTTAASFPEGLDHPVVDMGGGAELCIFPAHYNTSKTHAKYRYGFKGLPLVSAGSARVLDLNTAGPSLPITAVQSDISISLPAQEKIAEPGDGVAFRHILQNNGPVTRSLTMTLQSAQNNTIALSQGALSLAPGASDLITAQVTLNAAFPEFVGDCLLLSVDDGSSRQLIALDTISTTVPAPSTCLPSITITTVPAYGTTDDLSGDTACIDPDDYAVAAYIKTGGWWTKPTFASPLSAINPDGTWTIDITTGSGDEYSTQIAVYLVPNGYVPPQMGGGLTLPAELSNLDLPADSANRGPAARFINFSGYTWEVKESPIPVGPGPNYFSDDINDIWVDGSGRLHMKIVNKSGTWYSTELYLTESLGYGTYKFTITSPVSLLDENTVLGLFTWDNGAPADNYREIDIEFSRWGSPSNDNSQYVVQPYTVTANMSRFQTTGTMTNTVHLFDWQPAQLVFESYLNTPPSLPQDKIYNSWVYTGSDAPDPGDERVHINFWLMGGSAPVDGQEAEIVIESFEFITHANTVLFAAIGDYGEDTPEQADVDALIDTWNVDFIITAGDNRYGARTYDQTNGKYYCDLLKDVISGTFCAGGSATINAFFPSTGNHDYSDGLGAGINEYLDYFNLPGAGIPTSGTSGGELYYDFIRGPVHFFVIDSQGALSQGTMAAQQSWLQAQMPASTSPWQIVYLHHAPYSSSSNHGSNPSMQWDFAGWGADVVIAGHDHTYERIFQDGIVYFVNGLGGRSLYGMGPAIAGSQVRFNADYGAMRIEAAESQITFQFYSRTGALIDNFILQPSASTKTIQVPIAGSLDDVEERTSDGVVDVNSSDIEIGDDPGFNEDQVVGLRFTNISVPPGAIIQNAYLEFETDEADAGVTTVNIWGQSSSDAPAFAAANLNVTNRITTTAVVPWSNIPAWNTINEHHQSPNLASIVQEIIDLPGWNIGNAMAFIISGTGSRTAESYDGEPAAAAILHIEYSYNGPNYDPTADFNFTTWKYQANFYDRSSDLDGSISEWLWEFGDGITSTLQSPTHTYGITGTYNVTLTVTDDDGGMDTTGLQVSLPSASSVRFAAIGDYGEDSIEQEDVDDLIDTWGVDFIVTAGDNRYGSTTYDQTNGKYYCDFLKDVTSGANCAGGTAPTNAFFPSTGNHDYSDGLGGGISEYLAYFNLPGDGVPTTGSSGSELYYDFVRGPVHFFVIDSQAAIQSSANRTLQQAWLQAQMSASTLPWQIVLLHHAPYSSSSNHGSNTTMQWNYAAWGANAVIAGHDHTYERIEQDGILYFVNGLGGRSIYGLGTPISGSQVQYNGDYGAMLIEASEATITFQFYNRSGTLIDSYTLLPPPTKTEYSQISAGSDDVEEDISDGSIYINSSDLELGRTEETNPGPQLIGLRFNDIEIPPGATVISAYIEFERDETEVVSSTLIITGEASANAAPYTSSAYDVSTRDPTTATVTWADIPIWSISNGKHQTPDLAAIVQEIIDMPGWSKGNSMAFMIGGTGTRTAEAFEGEPQNAPLLVIEYEIDPAPVVDLTAAYSGTEVLLDWSEVDKDILGGLMIVDHYEVHRSPDPYFTPDGSTLITTTTATTYTDPGKAGVPGEQYFYIIIVVDWGGRASAISNRVGEFDFALIPGD